MISIRIQQRNKVAQPSNTNVRFVTINMSRKVGRTFLDRRGWFAWRIYITIEYSMAEQSTEQLDKNIAMATGI